MGCGSVTALHEASKKHERLEEPLCIQVMTIPHARALILDDQPAMADQAVAAWTRNVISSRRLGSGLRVRLKSL
jgi:hypothetical protein